ncbi:beta strand repeat-containing protein [Pyxidicoccus trucidator]|uniref:beta strand repeat-containing protein n=1 Tax=Pyxidicoccus trucidator TaxID=2709662 RepID=UPI0013DAD6CB|nr:Ig-like domain-containing protein [Pyxidicoccus trucidator]
MRGICGFILIFLAIGCGSSVSSSLAISPSTATVGTGQTQVLNVERTFSDGSKQAVDTATWTTSAAGIATVSETGVVTGVSAGRAIITAAVGDLTATATVTVTAPTPVPVLVSISATPATVALTVGDAQPLAVTGSYDDDTSVTLTSSAAFASSAPDVATVSAAGVITAVAAGDATITVTASGKTATVSVTVVPVAPTLVSISVTPNPVPLTPGATAQLLVTGTYSSGPTRNLTSSATFTTLAPATATVSAAGLVTAVASGSTTITASVTPEGATAVAGSTVVNVTPDPAGVVFYAGAYGAGVQLTPFGDSTNDVSVDTATTLNDTGHASLKIVFPESGYTGGAFVDTRAPRDLTSFDAVTFWAKASEPLTFEKVGFGNNAVGPNLYDVEQNGFALTTTWQKFIVPIPLASKLTALDGLFHFADGTNHSPTGTSTTLWLADIQYERLGSSVLGEPTPAWLNTAAQLSSGASYTVQRSDLKIDYTINSQPITLRAPSPGYFTFASDHAGAVVGEGGLITGTNAGTSPLVANITASLGTVSTANQLALTVTAGALATPTTLPPVPARPAGAEVISVYSSVPGGYNGTASDRSANVDTWRACWSAATGGDVLPITVGSQTANPRQYVMTPAANYVGIELLGKTGATQPGSCNGTITGSNELDISAMTHLHVDVWTPDNVSNLQFKLVDAGPNGQMNGGEMSGIATLTPNSTPPLATGQWLSYDLSFATDFPGNNFGSSGANLKHFGQLVIVAPNGGTVYVDNIYFFNNAGGGGGDVPTSPPAAPTAPPESVISLYSAAYTGGVAGGDYSGRVGSYSASCFGPPGTTVADYTIAGTSHVVKKYTVPSHSFAIIELIGATGGTPSPPDSVICHGGTQTGANLIDATTMTTLHFDVWSPDGSPNFQVHLVNADGTSTIAGPGAASGASAGNNFASGANTVGAGTWVSFDVPLSALGPPGAPGGLNRLGLLKFFTTAPGTFYIDNVYFRQ